MDRRMRLTQAGKDIARAVAFLSRIPMPARLFDDAAHNAAARQAWAYPLAGLIIGMVGALIIAILGTITSSLLTALITIAVTTVITGALHEDGLADIADGFWGGWTIERRLEIMKDSTVGAYGVLALIFWFSLSAFALAEIIAANSAFSAALIWLLICAVSRAAMPALWATTPSARTGGVAHAAGQPTMHDAKLSGLIALVFTIVTMLFGAPFSVLLAVALAGLAVFGFRRMCLNKIGGHTGDTLGAAQKVAETVMLISLAIML